MSSSPGIAPNRDCRSAKRSSLATEFTWNPVNSRRARLTAGSRPYVGLHTRPLIPAFSARILRPASGGSRGQRNSAFVLATGSLSTRPKHSGKRQTRIRSRASGIERCLESSLGCGLRRKEAAELEVAHLQRREDHWAIVDLVGKGRHIRTVPVPDWVKTAIDSWLASAEVSGGRMFRCVCRAGKTWGSGVTERAVWHVVKECAKKAAIENLAPHDLLRTCARLCRDAGGELDQIQFLLGHVSVQTTERYLGCKQRLKNAVNDRIGIEPNS